MTDDYRKRMQELEKRLNFQPAFSVANQTSQSPEEGIGRISIVNQNKVSSAASKSDSHDVEPGKKKGVHFAQQLDINEQDEASSITQPSGSKRQPEINPLSEVVERTSREHDAPAAPTAPAKKPSRFKRMAKSEAPSDSHGIPDGPDEAPVRFLDQDRITAPSGPEGQTLSDDIVERDVASNPVEPDEFDANLLHQEAAVEYHRVRNRLIQKQGGFVKEQEAAVTPLDEDDGAPKRMSRFKAARLSRQ
jgi:unconventional prefoldin RPB5 interactor 1